MKRIGCFHSDVEFGVTTHLPHHDVARVRGPLGLERDGAVVQRHDATEVHDPVGRRGAQQDDVGPLERTWGDGTSRVKRENFDSDK